MFVAPDKRSGAPLDPLGGGQGPSDPLGLGGLLGTDLSGVFGATSRSVLDSLGVTSSPGRSSPGGGRGSAGLVEPPDRPDRVSRMPGGAEVVRRRRRERYHELLHELLNVGIGAGAALLASAALLVTLGADFATAGALAALAAGGWGFVFGRDVLADMGRVKERSERDAERW